jgi:putative ABC transport system permease protein
MTAGRWIAGLIFLAGGTALIILAPVGGAGGGPALAMNVPLCAAVAAAALSPLLVPAFAGMLPVRFAGVTGQLASANLADGRRRSASVAAPVIVLVALVLGQATAASSFTASGVAEQRRGTAADLVVESSGPAPAVRSTAGVQFSSETEVPITITTGRGEDEETEIGSALVIDPLRYAAAHPGAGDLSALTGAVAAAGPGGMASIGDTVRVRLADGDLGALRVVAEVPEAMSGGPDLLLPAGLVPADRLREAPTRTFVTVAGDPAPVAAALAGSGTVRTVDDYLAADAAARGSISNKILLVVLGLGALYALIGVVNSVVIGAAARRREFAEARATGMTRGHVIRAALLESAAVTSAGLALGGLAAGLTFIAVLSSTRAVTGTATLDLPWPVAGGLVATAFAVTGVTSVITSWSATRQRPVVLLGARE